jgi:hypothetical protein
VQIRPVISLGWALNRSEAPNLQSVRANPTGNLQTASANAASGQRPCNLSAPIRPVISLGWALGRSEAPNLQSVRPNSTRNLCEHCRALVEQGPPFSIFSLLGAEQNRMLTDRVPHTPAGSRSPLSIAGSVLVEQNRIFTAQRSYPAHHGGLTPAALGHVRSIAKIAFCRQTFARQHKSGGRKPPVACTPDANSKRGNSSHCVCRRGLQTHGGLTPAAPVRACGEDVRVWGRIVVALTLARPRRADGRRSRLPVRCSLNKIGYSLLSGTIPHTTAG